MRPGTVFGIDGRSWLADRFDGATDAYVVIDDKTEIRFWTGGKSILGDVAPSMYFEVLSEVTS